MPELDPDAHETLSYRKTCSGVDLCNNQIIGYDLPAVLRGGVFKMAGGVFVKGSVLFLAFVIVGLSYAVTYWCVWASNQEPPLFEPGGNLTAAIGAVHDFFAGFTAFLFSYFVFDSLSMYLALKNDQVGSFCGNFVDLMFLTSYWIPGTEGDDLEFKEQVIKWGMAAYAMTCYTGAETLTIEEAVNKCVDKGYLTVEEAHSLEKAGNNPVVPILWIIPYYTARIPLDGRISKMEERVQGMRAGLGNALTTVSSFGDAPLALISLMSAIVKIELFFLVLKSGFEMAELQLSDSDSWKLQLAMSVTMTFMTPVFYQGLLEFVIQLRNPFGSDWTDLPTLHMQTGFKDFLLLIARGKKQNTAVWPASPKED